MPLKFGTSQKNLKWTPFCWRIFSLRVSACASIFLANMAAEAKRLRLDHEDSNFDFLTDEKVKNEFF